LDDATCPTVAVLTTRIHYMITHMREHPKDVHSRRGLEAMVQKRRSMLLYLRKKNLRGYLELLRDLGLKPLVTPKSSKFR
jgi:small subunit ribosomal protein S15